MFSTLEALLFAQAAVTAIILLIFGLMLARRDLFRWTTTGFWAWVSFALYFLINPLASVKWNIERYSTRLLLSGGIDRGQWIMLVSAVGIVAFFVVYLHTQSQPVTWRLSPVDRQITSRMGLVMAVIFVIAGQSLLTYRAGLLSASRDFAFDESGRFIGEATGYDYVGHTFLFVPIAMLLLSPSRGPRWLGWLAAGSYIALSAPDPWARFTTVSMMLVITLADALQRGRSRPRLALIVAAIILASVLQIRGRQGTQSVSQLYDLVSQVPEHIGQVLASDDAAMLASWYLRSFVNDSTGYDYGLPFVNYVLLDAIPSRAFPQKYFLVDWLRSSRPYLFDPMISRLLGSAKSTLLGSFYANGGILAVVLQMGLVGLLSRKMDGMLGPDRPILVQATAISWMSMLWMIWGSSDTWGAIRVGTMLMPAVVLWVVSPKTSTQLSQTRQIGGEPASTIFSKSRLRGHNFNHVDR